MRVIRLHGRGDLRLTEEQEPWAGEGESVVSVTAVGICGSDLHWFESGGIGETRVDRPLVLGHEFAGEVERGGGRRVVAVDPAVPCERCDHCLEGNVNLCEKVRFAGHGGDDGALRQFMAWPSHCLVDLPAGMSAVDGAMLEPLGVAIHSVDLGKVFTGSAVGVFGCGPIGLLTIQVARAAGATRIIATDPLEHRIQAAIAHGATEAFQAAGGAEIPGVIEATRGRGVDVAFEAAGADEAVHTAVETARAGARVVLIGIPSDDATTVTASAARRKGLTLKWVRRMKHTYARAIALVESGQVDVRSMVSHRFTLEEYDRAFEVARSRVGLKVVIDPSA